MYRYPAIVILCAAMSMHAARAAEPLKVGVFAVDASPPVGSPLAYDPTKGVAHPLSCRGIVLIGSGRPVVLCAVDWIGIANDGQVEFRQALADAAGTDPRAGRHSHAASARRSVLRFFDRSSARQTRDQPRDLRCRFRPRVIARAAAAVRRRHERRPVGHPPGPGRGRGRKGRIKSAQSRARRQGRARALDRVQRPAGARPTGRHDRPAAQDDQLLGRSPCRSWP